MAVNPDDALDLGDLTLGETSAMLLIKNCDRLDTVIEHQMDILAAHNSLLKRQNALIDYLDDGSEEFPDLDVETFPPMTSEQSDQETGPGFY